MDPKTRDADIEQNAVTVTGPHRLLTLADSLICNRRMYRYTTKSFYSKHNIIAHAHIKFYFILVKFTTGPANPSSIKKFNGLALQ